MLKCRIITGVDIHPTTEVEDALTQNEKVVLLLNNGDRVVADHVSADLKILMMYGSFLLKICLLERKVLHVE